MTERLERQKALLDKATRVVALIGFSGLVGICVLIMFDGLARYLFLPRVPGLGDLGEVLYTVIIVSCFPAGLLHNQNVNVSFLGDFLGAAGRRWLDAFAALVTFAFFAALTFEFFRLTVDLQESGRVTSTILMPMAPWWWIAALVLAVTVPVQLWVVAVRVAAARSGADLIALEPLASTDHVLEERLGRAEDEGDH